MLEPPCNRRNALFGCVQPRNRPDEQARHVVSERIGDPARKHGVTHADFLHAVRDAVRLVEMHDDLTMLIGAASSGALLGIGVLDIDGDDPVAIHARPLRQKLHRFLK